MKPRVTIYSDYICPFCYIGKAGIDRLQKDFDMDVEWKGFEIHPETPKQGATLEDIGMDQGYLETLMRNVEKLAKDVNLEIRLPSRLSNSKMALKIAEFAKNKGKFKEYHDEVFKAYWLEEKDIGDSGVLFNIVERVGLDVGDLKEYLKSGLAAKKISEYLQEIRGYGISGVPTFFIGYDIFTGVQPYEVLKKAVEDALAGD